jgi:hypothetical protein
MDLAIATAFTFGIPVSSGNRLWNLLICSTPGVFVWAIHRMLHVMIVIISTFVNPLSKLVALATPHPSFQFFKGQNISFFNSKNIYKFLKS